MAREGQWPEAIAVANLNFVGKVKSEQQEEEEEESADDGGHFKWFGDD